MDRYIDFTMIDISTIGSSLVSLRPRIPIANGEMSDHENTPRLCRVRLLISSATRGLRGLRGRRSAGRGPLSGGGERRGGGAAQRPPALSRRAAAVADARQD